MPKSGIGTRRLKGARPVKAPVAFSERIIPGTHQSHARTEDYDSKSMEHGILALLSFLGHSYKRGTISDDRYREVTQASLQKLDQIRQKPPVPSSSYEESYEQDAPDSSIDMETQLDKLTKNQQDLEAMLSFLEESYNEGSISEESYHELKLENSKRLQRVSHLIQQHDYSGEETETDGRMTRPSQSHRRLSQPLGDDFDVEGLAQLTREKVARQPRFEAPPELPPAPQLPKPRTPLYNDLNESFDRDAIVDEARTIMGELDIKDRHKAQKRMFEDEESEEHLPDEVEAPISGNVYRADSAVTAPAPAQKKGGDQVSNFMNKLTGLMHHESKPSEASSSEPKMYGSGSPEDPFRSTPEVQAPQVAPPAEEKSLSQQLGGEDTGGGAASGKVIMELEKLKVKVDGLGEMRNSLEERLGHIMESVGELRQMLFERDAGLKEQEAKVSRFMDMVEELEPQKLMKELEKRDRTIGEYAMRIEKQETMGQDLAKNVNRTKELLEGIGSLKNISEVNKQISEKVVKIDSTVNKADRLSEEIGRVYVDMNRRLEEFMTYKGKQDLMAESVKDLVQLVESSNTKLEQLASKDDLSDITKQLDESKLRLEELHAKQLLAEQGRDLPHELKEMKKQKEGLELILTSNEEEFLEKAISEADYQKTKEANLKRLNLLENQIHQEFSKIAGQHHTEDLQAAKLSQSLEKAVSEPAPVAPISQTSEIPAAPPAEAPSTPKKKVPKKKEASLAITSPDMVTHDGEIANDSSPSPEPGASAPSPTMAAATETATPAPKAAGEEDLEAMQKRLEEKARTEVKKIAEGKRKLSGNPLKNAVGSLVNRLKPSKNVLSSKPLRMGSKVNPSEEKTAAPEPTNAPSPWSSTPLKTDDRKATDPKRSFTTWRDNQKAHAPLPSKSVGEQAKVLEDMKEEDEEASQTAESYAISATSADDDQSEERIEARLKEIKALRNQYRSKDEFDHKKRANRILKNLKDSMKTKNVKSKNAKVKPNASNKKRVSPSAIVKKMGKLSSRASKKTGKKKRK
ncbi:hypothetical protein KJ765_00510 [Candidatus Micrarchaeota archaeon]|nr:hypothetical protein [Candidatus Micrarchaeota archaeon]